jgi:hypothetical protein
MKKIELFLLMVLLVVVSLVIVSCGGNGTKTGATEEKTTEATQPAVAPAANLIFGELPAMVSDYKKKIADLEAEIKNNKDMDKAVKLNKELKDTKDEADNAIENYIKNLSKPLTVPVIQEGNKELYKISEIVVEKGYFKNVTFKASVEIIKLPMPEGTIYIQFYTGEQPSSNWLIFRAVGLKGGFKEGQIFQFGTGTNPEKLIGVTKIVAKTRADYDASKKK